LPSLPPPPIKSPLLPPFRQINRTSPHPPQHLPPILGSPPFKLFPCPVLRRRTSCVVSSLRLSSLLPYVARCQR
jgi:hypothetical protein